MIRINGCNWRVAFVPGNSRKLIRQDGSRTIGMCDCNDMAIYLFDGLHGALLKKVMLHEVTHAAIFSYGVYMDLEQEELFCDLLSTYGEEIIDVVDGFFSALGRLWA